MSEAPKKAPVELSAQNSKIVKTDKELYPKRTIKEKHKWVIGILISVAVTAWYGEHQLNQNNSALQLASEADVEISAPTIKAIKNLSDSTSTLPITLINHGLADVELDHLQISYYELLTKPLTNVGLCPSDSYGIRLAPAIVESGKSFMIQRESALNELIKADSMDTKDYPRIMRFPLIVIEITYNRTLDNKSYVKEAILWPKELKGDVIHLVPYEDSPLVYQLSKDELNIKIHQKEHSTCPIPVINIAI